MIVTLMVLSLIGGRLVQLQGLDRAAYAASAEDQQLHTVILTADRGSITDRNGHVLATTVDAKDVVADPDLITDPTSAAATLAPLLHRAPATILAQLQVHTEYALLTPTPVTPAVAQSILASKVPGLTTPDTSERIYPDGTLASNVIGFLGANGQGLGGLELGYQQQLAGHNGKSTYQVGANGEQIPDGSTSLTPAVAGETLRLSLQRDIQFEAQQAISRQVKATHAKAGTVIVMNPSTGQILALAVAPGFNPNDINASTNNELGDPAVTDVYEPGSVLKTVTVSAALQHKLVTPTSKFVIPNSYDYGGSTFHDAESHATEHLTLTGILAESSNIGAIKVAERVGPQRLYSYLREFGFGQPTGVGLPGDGQGLLTPVSQWSGTTLPTLAFGQGIGVTAMQVASLYSTIANGGVRVTPNIVTGTVSGKNHFQPAPAPARRRVVSAHVAEQMRNVLETVTTDEGTGPLARISGYRIAGKTGTAAQANGHGGYSGYDATFVGMAPADKPQLVCEVVLEKPVRGYYGGQVAAPVFHDVMSFALQTMHIAPTFTKAPKARLTW
ncbi:MAG TPA: penicillin-binding protein 2 [Mycobacteriales bacterium]|jgi:cell division protein FtsI (penicillin-binding protein 3)|nr:penicillin-binding protein 2 [Mycobacteriales bacterium]